MIYKFTNSEKISVFIVEHDGSYKRSLLVSGVDPANTDYQQYLAWLAEGNEPLPAEQASPAEQPET